MQAAPDREPLYAGHVATFTPPEPVTVPPCVVCTATRAEKTFRIDGVDAPVVVCSGCGVGYFHPMPAAETIAGYYPTEYYGDSGEKFRPGFEALMRFAARREARMLTRGLSPGARVLDVGCGRGVLLRAVASLGFSAHGFEVSRDASPPDVSEIEVRIAPSLEEAGYPAASFDEIIVWHVLEHVPDPYETLRECHRILRPGGRLVVAVPNFSSAQARWSGAAWFHLDLPRHLFHFPAEALRQLLERAGFACASTHHFSLSQNPFGWVQSALNRSPRRPRNALYEAMNRKNDAEGAGGLSWGMTALFLASMPPALALSLAMAALSRGATVHVVATRAGVSE